MCIIFYLLKCAVPNHYLMPCQPDHKISDQFSTCSSPTLLLDSICRVKRSFFGDFPKAHLVEIRKQQVAKVLALNCKSYVISIQMCNAFSYRTVRHLVLQHSQLEFSRFPRKFSGFGYVLRYGMFSKNICMVV